MDEGLFVRKSDFLVVTGILSRPILFGPKLYVLTRGTWKNVFDSQQRGGENESSVWVTRLFTLVSGPVTLLLPYQVWFPGL